MRNINLLTGINGVVAGGVATLDIPVNRRYHALKVFLSATVGGNPNTNPVDILESVRLIVNGVVMRDLLPADILAIANLNKRTPNATTGELPIYFSEPWRASVIGEESTSWDMFGQSKFTLEMTFKATAVNPSAVCEASFDYGRNRDASGKNFLAIVKQLRFTRSNPVGDVDLVDLPQSMPIQRIHLRVSAGVVNSAEVWNDTVKVFEGTTARFNDFYKDYDLTPAAASTFALSLVFDFTQQISDALMAINQNLNVRPNCSVAGSITAIVEHRAPGYV